MTKSSIKISLPYPDPILNPNKKPHWAPKNKAFQQHRDWAIYATGLQKLELSDHYGVIIILHPPDRRKRDLDNAKAACKAYFDGIASALNIDDSLFYPQYTDWGEVVKGGSVEFIFCSNADSYGEAMYQIAW
jgi:Holliday junction resolvase RusA-like endonuclease